MGNEFLPFVGLHPVLPLDPLRHRRLHQHTAIQDAAVPRRCCRSKRRNVNPEWWWWWMVVASVIQKGWFWVLLLLYYQVPTTIARIQSAVVVVLLTSVCRFVYLHINASQPASKPAPATTSSFKMPNTKSTRKTWRVAGWKCECHLDYSRKLWNCSVMLLLNSVLSFATAGIPWRITHPVVVVVVVVVVG